MIINETFNANDQGENNIKFMKRKWRSVFKTKADISTLEKRNVKYINIKSCLLKENDKVYKTLADLIIQNKQKT